MYYKDTQQNEKQNLSKGGVAPCEPTAINIECPTVSADVLLLLGYFFIWRLVAGFALALTTLYPTKHTKSKKKSENPHRGRTFFAAALRRAAHRMTGLEQILRD